MRRPFKPVLMILTLISFATWASSASAQDALTEVEMETSEGTIVIELNAEKAPKTVANFLEYVDSGFYDGTVFHRVIKDFMIQCGGFDQSLAKKETRPPVVNEGGNGLPNKEYTVAMARTPVPNSATSQFFINTQTNPFLDRKNSQDGFGYAVFGRVVKGLDVVDRIEAAATTKIADPENPGSLMENVPAKPIVIKKISRKKKD